MEINFIKFMHHQSIVSLIMSSGIIFMVTLVDIMQLLHLFFAPTNMIFPIISGVLVLILIILSIIFFLQVALNGILYGF